MTTARSESLYATVAGDAQLKGVPVVLPAHGAFPEIAAAAGCGVLISDSKPETLARAWTELLSDPERLRRESELGRTAAKGVFSQNSSAAALERVLSTLCRE